MAKLLIEKFILLNIGPSPDCAFPGILDSRTPPLRPQSRAKSPIAHARSPLGSPAKTPNFSRRPRLHTFRRAPRPHHHPSLPRRHWGRHGQRRLLAGGGKAPGAQARCGRSRSLFVSYVLCALGFDFFLSDRFRFRGWIDARQAQGFISFFKKLPKVRLSQPDPWISSEYVG